MQLRVLILTRDAQLFLLLRHMLAAEGIFALPAGSEEEVLGDLASHSPQAVIIDCSVAAVTANAIQALRKCKVRVVLLFDRLSSAVDGLSNNDDADFVLEQPFDPVGLIDFLRRMRLDALAMTGGAADPGRLLRFADLEMNLAAARVSRNGRDIPLTALQFRLLRHLLQHAETAQSREQLIAGAWPPDADVEPRTVDIHIGHLRRALKSFGPDLIRTVRSLGYVLDPRSGSND